MRIKNDIIISFNNIYSVKGCQTPGYYGSDCSSPCPNVNCQHCHIETGICQGCMPGYQGQQCELGKTK